MDTYEKKYKEALERARQFSEHPLQEDSSNIVEYIFPELDESEDKKIRKVIIGLLKQSTYEDCDYDGVNMKDIYAWLEKQGEPIDINPSEFDLRLNKLLKQFESLPKEELANSLSFYLNVVQNDGTYKPDEGQGEQKPADKVEPKFHKGEWIVWQGKCYKVNYNGCGYELVDQNGLSTSLEYGTIDENAHLWDITKDAKDGDVLACPLPKGYEAGEQIFIFKEINSRDYVENCIEYYCRVCEGEFYENETGYMGTTSSPIYPATKEQRDTLMKAMADAGWGFDFEKKELKKIEQKYTTMSLDEAIEHCKEKSCGNNACALEHKQLERWLTELKKLKE